MITPLTNPRAGWLNPDKGIYIPIDENPSAGHGDCIVRNYSSLGFTSVEEVISHCSSPAQKEHATFALEKGNLFGVSCYIDGDSGVYRYLFSQGWIRVCCFPISRKRICGFSMVVHDERVVRAACAVLDRVVPVIRLNIEHYDPEEKRIVGFYELEDEVLDAFRKHGVLPKKILLGQ